MDEEEPEKKHNGGGEGGIGGMFVDSNKNLYLVVFHGGVDSDDENSRKQSETAQNDQQTVRRSKEVPKEPRRSQHRDLRSYHSYEERLQDLTADVGFLGGPEDGPQRATQNISSRDHLYRLFYFFGVCNRLVYPP